MRCSRVEQRESRSRIDAQRAHDQFLFRGVRTACPAAAAAADRPDAGQEFAGRKCLRQIIVGAHLQTHDAVGFLAAGREHEHRHVRTAADAPEHLEPVHFREHDIEDHSVKFLGHRPFDACGAGVLGDHLVPQRLEIIGDQLAQLAVVVDDKDFHGTSPFRSRQAFTADN
jgi:hypothetical protein